MLTFPSLTIGVDVGDRHTQLFAVDAEGTIVEEGRLPTTPDALEHRFSTPEPARVVLEVGTHSPWMSRLLEGLGHEVLVANPRVLYRKGEDKSDPIDAESLARWGRSDPKVLRPIQHRAEAAQVDLAQVRDAITEGHATPSDTHIGRNHVASISASLRRRNPRLRSRSGV